MPYRQRIIREVAFVFICLGTTVGTAPRGACAGDGGGATSHLSSNRGLTALPEGRLDSTGARVGAAACLDEGAGPDEQEAVYSSLHGNEEFSGVAGSQRWMATASQGILPPAGSGQPIILTYGIVPDGTPIGPLPNGQSATSNLIATLNSVFGAAAVWQPIIDGALARWSATSGILLVPETADDGGPGGAVVWGPGGCSVGDPWGPNPGLLGTRADIRICGTGFSPTTVLGFGQFPCSGGDVVLNTTAPMGATPGVSTLYGPNAPAANWLKFRNLVAHEVGHALGLDHSCPNNGVKLMEEFISTAFDGPQLDDVRGVNRFYGDSHEEGPAATGDAVSSATPLGALPFGVSNFGDPATGDERLGLESLADEDYYSVVLPPCAVASITVSAVGICYVACACPNSSCTPTNGQTAYRLTATVFDASGAILAPEQPAVLTSFPACAGIPFIQAPISLQTSSPAIASQTTVVIRVRGLCPTIGGCSGADPGPQLYGLSIAVTGAQTGGAPVVVGSPPAVQTLCPGYPAALSVAATGAAPLTYQWRKNGMPILGSTGPVHLLPSVVAGDAGAYDCVVSNLCGAATSNTSTVMVGPQFDFSVTQPAGPGSLSFQNVCGPPLAIYFTAISLDMANTYAYGFGFWGGLHIGIVDLLTEFSVGTPPFLGILDSAGSSNFSLPGGSLSFLAGVPLYGVTVALDAGLFPIGITNVGGQILQ